MPGTNVTKAELLSMILELRREVDALKGKQRGPITMREYRLAGERGDKVTMALYLQQFERNPSLCERWTAKGGGNPS